MKLYQLREILSEENAERLVSLYIAKREKDFSEASLSLETKRIPSKSKKGKMIALTKDQENLLKSLGLL